MRTSLARMTQLGGLVPPKIATPKLVASDSGAGLGPLVEFYSKLPKGRSPSNTRGIKGRWFNGANASGKPLIVLIATIFGIGYTIDYQLHLKHHKNHAH